MFTAQSEVWAFSLRFLQEKVQLKKKNLTQLLSSRFLQKTFDPRHGGSISSFGQPVVRDEDGVPEDSLDPLTDGHCRAAVQAGDCEGSCLCFVYIWKCMW